MTDQRKNLKKYPGPGEPKLLPPFDEEGAFYYIFTRRLLLGFLFYFFSLIPPMLVIPAFFMETLEPPPYSDVEFMGVSIDVILFAYFFDYAGKLSVAVQVGFWIAAIKTGLKVFSIFLSFERRVFRSMALERYEIDPNFFRDVIQEIRHKPFLVGKLNDRLVDYAEDESQPVKGRLEAIRISGAYMSARQLDIFDADMSMAFMTEGIHRALLRKRK